MTSVIIFNPHSGKKQGLQRLRSLPLDRLGQFELWPTRQPEHAEELAFSAAKQGFSVVISAGGDGTVHEVANGLLRSGETSVALGVIPIGSANDYFHSIEREGQSFPGRESFLVDVGQVSEPAGKTSFFICCLGLGFNGAVTMESRKILGLQGIALYGLATLRALIRHYGCSPLQVALDDLPAKTKPTLMLSVMVGRREGGFVMAPNARLTDGLFDYVHAGALTRWQVLGLLPRLALFGAPSSYPGVELGQCRKISVKAKSDLISHIDGEFFCRPGEGIRELNVELLPGHLRIFKCWDLLSQKK